MVIRKKIKTTHIIKFYKIIRIPFCIKIFSESNYSFYSLYITQYSYIKPIKCCKKYINIIYENIFSFMDNDIYL